MMQLHYSVSRWGIPHDTPSYTTQYLPLQAQNKPPWLIRFLHPLRTLRWRRRSCQRRSPTDDWPWWLWWRCYLVWAAAFWALCFSGFSLRLMGGGGGQPVYCGHGPRSFEKHIKPYTTADDFALSFFFPSPRIGCFFREPFLDPLLSRGSSRTARWAQRAPPCGCLLRRTRKQKKETTTSIDSQEEKVHVCVFCFLLEILLDELGVEGAILELAR